MKLKFSPCSMDDRLEASVSGDTLYLNGVPFDFSPLQAGDILPIEAMGSKWIASSVERIDGEIHLTIVIPHGPDAVDETLTPVNFETYLAVTDGVVPIPAYGVSNDN